MVVKYNILILLDKDDLKHADHPPFVIEMGNATPIRQKMRPEPLMSGEFIQNEIHDLLDAGFIWPCTGEWCLPANVVKNANPHKPWHLTIDYSALNKVTTTQAVRVPPIEVLLCSVHNKPYISTLDLDAAYWLVPMHPDSVLKTGFTCMPSIFEWLVMPFSAKNAVTHFVHVIERELSPVIQCTHDMFIACYLDDIIITGCMADIHTQTTTHTITSITHNHLAHVHLAL